MSATWQEIVLAYTPKVGASISIPCSLFIIYESVLDHYKTTKGTNAIQRALVGMSCIDVMASFAWWLGTWAVPREPGEAAWLYTGNQGSCNFQGFLLQLAIGAPLYNCSLALYYVLVINYSWTNRQLIQVEKYVHAAILTFSIGTAIIGLPLTQYNRVGTVCWVIGDPVDCGRSSIGTVNEDVPCDRGDYSWIFGLFLFQCPLWFSVLLAIWAMILIFQHVQKTLTNNKKYDFESKKFNGSRRSVVSSVYHPDTEYRFQYGANETTFDNAGGNAATQQQQQQQRQQVESSRGDDDDDDDDNDNDGAAPASDDAASGGAATGSRSSEYRPTQSRQSLGSIASIDEELVGQHYYSTHQNNNNNNNNANNNETASQSSRNASRRRHRQSRQAKRQRKQQMNRVFAMQAILYSISFVVTWAPSTVWSIASWFGNTSPVYAFLSSFCEPLQGLWNLLIFLRQRPESQEKIKHFFKYTCCGICFKFNQIMFKTCRRCRIASINNNDTKSQETEAGTTAPTIKSAPLRIQNNDNDNVVTSSEMMMVKGNDDDDDDDDDPATKANTKQVVTATNSKQQNEDDDGNVNDEDDDDANDDDINDDLSWISDASSRMSSRW